MPKDGDELWTVWRDWSQETVQPPARLQERIYWNGSIVTEFCVQLEYNPNHYLHYTDPDWLQVARFDHNVDENQGHDIRNEGLHLDIYDQHGKAFVDTDFATPPLREAPGFCRDYLERYKDRYLAEFERRIGVQEVVRVYDSS